MKTMYKTLLLGLLLSLGTLVNAQTETLLDTNPIKFDWYGAFSIEPGQNPYHLDLSAGLEAGVILQSNILLGVFFTESLSGMYPWGYDPDEYLNFFDYGGLSLGYTFSPQKLIHPIIQLKSGWGNFALGENLGEVYTDLSCLVIQPTVGFEMNLNQNLKLSLAIHYRHTNSLDIFQFREASFDAAGVTLRITVGIFDDM